MIVRTNHELNRALSDLSDGEGGVIYVGPGTYSLDRWQIGTDRAQIEILPESPVEPPEFSSIVLKNSRNIAFDGIRFRPSAAQRVYRLMDGCRGIALRNADCEGDATGYVAREDGTPQSFALITDSHFCSIDSSRIQRYWQGASFVRSHMCMFRANRVRRMAGDGVRMSDVHGMFVLRNSFSLFFGSDQRINHSDMIQIWAKSRPSSSVLIEANRLDSMGQRGGAATQGILVLNEDFGKTGERHVGIAIVSNRLRNGHPNGIVAEHVDGLQLSDNRLTWDREAVMRYDAGPLNASPRLRLNGALGWRDID